MRVSEAALKFQVPRHYIDYWRKSGLLGPDGGNLSFEDLLKVRWLAAGRRHGVSLQRMRRLIREYEAGSSRDWYNRLTIYDNLEGMLLARDGQGLINPETGQLFFSYEESRDSATGGGNAPATVVDLPHRPSGETERGPWAQGADPALAGLEERYLRTLASGDFRKISKVLEEIMRAKPDHVAALIEFGNLCFEHQRLEDGLRYYERALEIQADCVEALYNVANIHFKAKRFAAAIRYFGRCIELDPDFPEAYYNLGLLYYSLRYFEQATECLASYTALDPDSVWSDQARQLVEDIQQVWASDPEHNRNLSLFE
jgi:tetratricopeptide (TPR) repeat protein